MLLLCHDDSHVLVIDPGPDRMMVSQIQAGPDHSVIFPCSSVTACLCLDSGDIESQCLYQLQACPYIENSGVVLTILRPMIGRISPVHTSWLLFCLLSLMLNLPHSQTVQ